MSKIKDSLARVGSSPERLHQAAWEHGQRMRHLRRVSLAGAASTRAPSLQTTSADADVGSDAQPQSGAPHKLHTVSSLHVAAVAKISRALPIPKHTVLTKLSASTPAGQRDIDARLNSLLRWYLDSHTQDSVRLIVWRLLLSVTGSACKHELAATAEAIRAPDAASVRANSLAATGDGEQQEAALETGVEGSGKGGHTLLRRMSQSSSAVLSRSTSWSHVAAATGLNATPSGRSSVSEAARPFAAAIRRPSAVSTCSRRGSGARGLQAALPLLPRPSSRRPSTAALLLGNDTGASAGRFDVLSALPTRLAQYILGFLSEEDLGNAASVCRRWASLISTVQLSKVCHSQPFHGANQPAFHTVSVLIDLASLVCLTHSLAMASESLYLLFALIHLLDTT